jgi:LacI family transcriptional regulator
MVPDIGNPTFHQILRGAMSAAAPHGYRVLVAETAENPSDEAEIALEARLRCDALILVAPRMGEDELLALLPRVEPLVVVNRRPANTVPTLWVDYADGVRALVAHLVALGHSELVYVAGPAGSTSGAARVAALREAVASNPGLVVRTVPCGSTVAEGYAVADQVLATHASAAVVFNDLVAFGLLARLNEAGVAVPDDISITGFDDIELARYATPSLTTAAVPLVELGGRAWQRLHDVITHPGDARARRTEDRFLPTVHVRTSTGPVPPGRTA